MINTVISPQINHTPSLRDNDLDIIKGLLVVIMILYHCASMAANTSPQLLAIAHSISFIHYAFLIITGFLCGWYYVPKMASTSQTLVRKRLRIRGLKIILILLLLNVILYAFRIMDSNKLVAAIVTPSDLFRNLNNGDLIAFEILWPIGLFLLLVSFVLVRKHMLIIATLFMCIILYLSNIVAYGAIGLVVGVLSQTAWAKKVWVYYEKSKIVPLIVLLGCSCSILLLKHFSCFFIPSNFYYTAETFFWFLGFMAIIKLLGSVFLSDACVLFGHYTLLGYISQMFIIRMIYIFLNSMGIAGYYQYVMNVFISAILLFLVLKSVTYIRLHFPSINSAYRLIFQ